MRAQMNEAMIRKGAIGKAIVVNKVKETEKYILTNISILATVMKKKSF